MKTEREIKTGYEIISNDLFNVAMSLKNIGADADKNLSTLLEMKELEGKLKILQWILK